MASQEVTKKTISKKKSTKEKNDIDSNKGKSHKRKENREKDERPIDMNNNEELQESRSKIVPNSEVTFIDQREKQDNNQQINQKIIKTKEEKKIKIKKKKKTSQRKEKSLLFMKKKDDKFSEMIRKRTAFERFRLGKEEVSRNLEELSNEYSVPEYCIIDLMLMAIKKIVPPSYKDSYNRSKFYEHIRTNLQKRYKNKLITETRISDLIDRIGYFFQEKYWFDLFTRNGDYDFDKYLNLVYENFKDKIDSNISKFVENLDKSQKIVLWILNYFIQNKKPFGLSPFTYSSMINYIKLIFSLNISEKYLQKTLSLAGIAHFGDYRSSNGRMQYNHGEFYDFWSEIPKISEILQEIDSSIPNFEEKLQAFLKYFNISSNFENVSQFIYLDYLINRNVRNLDNILTDSIRKHKVIKDYENIVREEEFNPFIYEHLKKSLEKIKILIFEEFKWLISFIQKTFNPLETDNIFYKIFKIIAENIPEFTIEVYPWYSEDIIFSENKLIILLFHPNLDFLMNTMQDCNIIAFGAKRQVLFYGLEEIMEYFSGLFQSIQDHEYKCVKKIVISPFELILDTISDSKKYIKRNILDETFRTSKTGKNAVSLLFDDNSLDPKLIFLMGENRENGIKILEDLIEEELKIWGLNNIKAFKHLGKLIYLKNGPEKIQEQVEKIEEKFYDTSIKLISIQVRDNEENYLKEFLLNIQKSGLRYIIINWEPLKYTKVSEKPSQEQILDKEKHLEVLLDGLGLKDISNIVYSIIDLPNYKKFNNFLKVYGKKFPEIEFFKQEVAINTSWNRFQRYLNNIKNDIKDKIFNETEVVSNVKYTLQETDYHYFLKCLVYLYLARIKKIENIQIEEDIFDEDNNKIRPDMFFWRDNEKIYIEIETGYPTRTEKEREGLLIDPVVRIKNKLLKYDEEALKGNLILVLPNMFCLLHKQRLKQLKNFLLANRIFNKLGFYSVDWSQYPKLKKWWI